MSDIEEEQPTQQQGRRDWNAQGEEETALEGHDELAGQGELVNERNATGTRAFDGPRMSAAPAPEDKPIFPDDTVGEEHKGQGDANPGGTLSRDPDARTGEHGPKPEDVEDPPQPNRRYKRD